MDRIDEKLLQPKVDHTPAELDEASRIMLAAADVIERQGWCQLYVGDCAGPVCMEGALAIASGRTPNAILECLPVTSEALRRIRKAVGEDAFRWNDMPRRTKEEVVAKLRAVALSA